MGDGGKDEMEDGVNGIGRVISNGTIISEYINQHSSLDGKKMD